MKLHGMMSLHMTPKNNRLLIKTNKLYNKSTFCHVACVDFFHKMTTTIPESFLCPITKAVMTDPVMDRDGFSYERAAIEAWVSSKGTSPMTRKALTLADLVPNRGLLDTIMGSYAVTTREEKSTPSAASFSVVPSIDVAVMRSGDDFLVRVIPPDAPVDGCRAAVDLVCVVDTSGSMSSDATVQDTAGHTESYGITVLDIVKHAVRSVAGMLGPNDRLAVVAFSSTARVVMPFTAMSVVGKETVTRVLGGLEPTGGTNLWDGQHVAMELARTAVNNTAILLLTDGCPTDHPPRGHIPTMTSYYDALGAKRSFSVHTFGFGYSLQSDLLNSIAEKSSGLFVFIPDAGLVGTVFINTVSSLLATVSSQVHLEIEVSNPSVWDAPLALAAPNVLMADVGALQFGQPRTFYIKAATSDTVVVRASAKIGEVVHTLTARLAEKTSEAVIAPFRFRSMFNSRLTAVLSDTTGAPRMAAITPLIQAMAAETSDSPLFRGLLEDLTGQVSIALGKDEHFTKWGRHYIPSLVRANVLEQCNNFKDKSVAAYGAEFFQKQREHGEAVFLKIPPPEPKTRGAAPADIHAYYTQGRGCVAGHCSVLLAGGRAIRFDEIRPGHVASSGGVVRTVVKIAVPPNSPLVTLPTGLEITPYHPISQTVDDTWIFPIHASGASLRMTTADDVTRSVYMVVMADHHSLVVNGMRVVTWGHGLEDNDVVSHPFFGSMSAITSALAKGREYAPGMIAVDGLMRDPVNNMVIGFSFAGVSQ